MIPVPPTRGPNLVVLMYHAVVEEALPVEDWCFVSASEFRRQLEHLSRHFEVMPLADAVVRLEKGRLSAPTVALTFDDGFQNNCDVALPMLREFNAPAAVFPATAFVGTNDTMWFCRLNRALADTARDSLEWDGRRFDLTTPTSKAKAASKLKTLLKSRPHPQLLLESRELLIRLDDDPERPAERGSPYRMLDRDGIAAMLASGLVEFGAHSRTHAILSFLSAQARRDEILGSIASVRELTGGTCRLFAYPNGQREDYAALDVGVLESAGIHAAVTAIHGHNDPATPHLELRRYGIGADLTASAFQRMMQTAAQE